MWRNRFWEWMEQYSGYVFGPILIGLSLVLGHYVAPIYPTRFMDELTVALMIAGILTTTVDPFMKRQARREATRDIFHHMLGFGLRGPRPHSQADPFAGIFPRERHSSAPEAKYYPGEDQKVAANGAALASWEETIDYDPYHQ